MTIIMNEINHIELSVSNYLKKQKDLKTKSIHEDQAIKVHLGDNSNISGLGFINIILKLFNSQNTLYFRIICFMLLICFCFCLYMASVHSTKAEILFNQSTISLHYIKANGQKNCMEYIKCIFLVPIGFVGIYVLHHI